MDADHQHLLIVGAVEDRDPAAGGQFLHRPPQEMMLQLRVVRGLEGNDIDALGIHAGHHVLDRTVLAGRIQRLENDEHRPAAVRPQQLLGIGQLGDVLGQRLLAGLLVFQALARTGFAIGEFKIVAGDDDESLRIELVVVGWFAHVTAIARRCTGL